MIEGIIGVEIPLYPQMFEDEIKLRLKQEEAAQLAMTCFCNGSITLEEYMDVLEMCEVDMDSYCLNVQQNLNATGLIIV